jgi:hypothetical protein
MPVRQNAGPDSEHGRGLFLVDAFSAEWESYRKANGKAVWATVGPAALSEHYLTRERGMTELDVDRSIRLVGRC